MCIFLMPLNYTLENGYNDKSYIYLTTIKKSNLYMRVCVLSGFSHVWLCAPNGLQPTRLLWPWYFTGKSTGVGCHCLLQIFSLLLCNLLFIFLFAIMYWTTFAPVYLVMSHFCNACLLFHCMDELLNGKEPTCKCRSRRFDLWVRKIPWRRKWLSAPVFLPGEFHEERSLACSSPWGCRVRHDWVTEQQATIV